MPHPSMRARAIGRSLALALALVAALVVPAPAAAAAPSCSVVFDTGFHLATGFYVPGTITNTGPTTLTGWRVTWRFSGAQQLTSLPNTRFSQAGPDVTAGNMPW